VRLICFSYGESDLFSATYGERKRSAEMHGGVISVKRANKAKRRALAKSFSY
jgi:hypothetical protein